MASILRLHEHRFIELLVENRCRRIVGGVLTDRNGAAVPGALVPDIQHHTAIRQFDQHAVIAPGPGHAIQLHSGRLVVALWMSTDHSHRPLVIATIHSDDHGRTMSVITLLR